jgi:ATP adenylyltransferase
MKHLCAPWRIEYIKYPPASRGCFLCKVLAADDDAENLVLVRKPDCFVVLNRYPYNPGHLLIAPNAHVAEPAMLKLAMRNCLFGLTMEMKSLLASVLKPQGFNIGINLGAVAGAGLVEHVHVHLVPRWQGDTNFMPVTGATKVLPQALADMYESLKQANRPRSRRRY